MMAFIKIDFSKSGPATEEDFDWWLNFGRPNFVLQDTGGLLDIGQVASLLSITEKEIEDRFYERSILVWEDVNLYESSFWIPAFQFYNGHHLEGFHDLWDILSRELGVERICQFFVYEKPILGIEKTTVELLRSGVTAEQMADLNMQAVAFTARYQATEPLDMNIWEPPKWSWKNKTQY